MIKRQIFVFLLRTIVSIFGMWLCISLFGHTESHADVALFVLAGVIFSLVNSIVKPLATTLALPLAILTMGISTILINIGMLALTIYLLPGVTMDFWGIFWSSLILSLINSLANLLMPSYNK